MAKKVVRGDSTQTENLPLAQAGLVALKVKGNRVRTVSKIISVEGWTKDGKAHTRTTALLDNGEESIGYGKYEVGDEVEAFFNEKWDYYQMQKPTKKK